MTDPLEAALLLSGKPSVATGLRACRLPVWLHDCISGKDITFHHCQRYAVATRKMKGDPLIMRHGVLVFFLSREIMR